MSAKNGQPFRKLMEWQPPDEKYGPILGILGTTYELDSPFVETDLLPAMLGLGAWDDRSWSSRVALERALAGLEATTILADQRKYRGRPRSLHVEVRPAVGRGGQLLHAKVLLIAHQDAIRFQVASANLTGAGYRENREVALPLVATKSRPALAAMMRAAIEAMPTLFDAWWTPSAQEVVRVSVEKLSAWAGVAPSDAAVLWGGRASSSLWKDFLDRWPSGEAVERISIVSPFWSEEGTHGPLTTLVGALRERGVLSPTTHIELYAEAEAATATTFRPQLPSLGAFDPKLIGVRVSVRAVQPLPKDEPGAADVLKARKLHAKVVVLHGKKQSLAYAGSANFTVKGWGFGAGGASANLEAGVVLLRKGEELAKALLPPTTGDPVELSVGTALPLPESTDEAQIPTFIDGVWLEPEAGSSDRLHLVLQVHAARIDGTFRVVSADDAEVLLFEGAQGFPRRSTRPLEPELLVRLLRTQQVRIRWEASSLHVDYPLNADLAARAQLPIVPESLNPGESLLLAYYQGRISAADLYPPPLGYADELEPEQDRSAESTVDTSRIQSYQVREFVEALQGLRDDLGDAAKGTPAGMRLALKGPVSPLALARQVREAARSNRRSATAAGFQLVEIASSLLKMRTAEGARADWPKLVDETKAAVTAVLAELASGHPQELGPGTAFAKYAKAVAEIRMKSEVDA